ncbi:MAG: anthranilate phosphoribosyltransferase, partial [Candidatus Dadabacteria bacterium]
MKEVLAKLVEGRPLAEGDVEQAVGTIMDGRATPAQIGAFLVALRMRGESVGDLVAAVRAVRARALRVSVAGPLVDTCGTGGDGLGTFNASTAAALVAAAGGVRVAKHGNRAASGKVGAADVLEAAGVRLELPPHRAAAAIEEIGFAFLFAPLYHPAFRHVAGPRREIGVRTLFNLVGPLCNPAGATRQVVGIPDERWLEPVAQALGRLGAEHVLV